MEQLMVVPESSIARGVRLQKFWMLGWVFGLVVSIGGAFFIGEAVSYRRAVKDLTAARREIESMRRDQDHSTAALVKAWEDQGNGINMISSWITYIKSRDEMVVFNKNNGSERIARRK